MSAIQNIIRSLVVVAMAFHLAFLSRAFAEETHDTAILSSATIIMVLRGNDENKPEIMEVAKGVNRPEIKEWKDRVAKMPSNFPKGAQYLWVIKTDANREDRLARAGQLFKIYHEDVILIKREKYEWRKFIKPTTI